jgi:hypothetical protein
LSSEKARDLAPDMVTVSQTLHVALREAAAQCCPDEEDRLPFRLAVLETMLAVHLAVSAREHGDMDGLIALSQRHLAEASREFYSELGA